MAKIITLKAFQLKTGLSRSTIYKLINSASFPCKIQLTDRRIGFLEEDVDAWIQSKVDSCKTEEAFQ